MQLIGGTAYNPGTGPQTFPTGPAALGGVLFLHNFSPYDLSITFNQDPTNQGFLPAWQTRKFDFKGQQVNNVSYSIFFTPSTDIINAAPSSYVMGEAFASSETIPDNLLNYQRVANVGNGVQLTSASDTFEQDFLTPFVLAGCSPNYTGFNLYSSQAGIAFLTQTDGSFKRRAFGLITQNLNYTNTTVYHDINPDGTYSIGTSHSTQANYLTISTIVFNVSGQITSVTDTRVMSTIIFPGMTRASNAPGLVAYNLHLFENLQADNQIGVQGTLRVTSGGTGNGYTAYIGANDELLFMPGGSSALQGVVFYGTVSLGPPAVDLPLFSIGSTFNVGAAYIDTSGVLHLNSPVVLIAGSQETGVAGYSAYAPGAVTQASHIANFKTVMTNTPSSMTTSNLIAPTNATGLNVNLITKYGFNMYWTTPGAGWTGWQIQYTTVGNCLTAVDTILGTFDHHCDSCGAIHSKVVSGMLSVSPGATPMQSAMSYTCPDCGAIEHFNCALTSQDELDQSTQGTDLFQTTRGEQATMIRQLMQMSAMAIA